MRWMKWFTTWFGGSTKSLGSLGIGLKAALSGGAPGGWASDHREETAHNTGFNYVAVHAIAAQVAGATVTVFSDGDQSALRRARRKFLAAQAGTFARWKSTYGADDRLTDPLPSTHALVRLLKHPNPYESGANFRYRQAQQVRLTGTCLIWNVPSISGPPCERYVIPTAMASPVAPTMDLPRGGWRISPVASRYTPVVDDGFVDCPSWYRILGQIIDARQVQLIRLPHAWYLDDGQSPLSAGAKWVDAGEAVDEARFHQLKNGIDPSIVWNLPPDISPDQDEIDRVQAKISAKYGGPENVGRVMVAQSGTTITPLSATPKEMCFTEGFHDFKAAILALHQTPPVAVGLQEPGAYAAYNASMKAWRHAAVQPLCEMLAESDTEHLAPHFGHGLTIEIESDTVDDAELLEQQLQNDLAARVRTRNEWRAVRGMPPLPGPLGDELVGAEQPQQVPGPAPSSPDAPFGTPLGFQNLLSQTKSDQSNTDPFEIIPSTRPEHELHSNEDEIRIRAQLIADILYAIYGDDAINVVEGTALVQEKAFNPNQPRDAQGRWIKVEESDREFLEWSEGQHTNYRKLIGDILSGREEHFLRANRQILRALRWMTIASLRHLHREHGVKPIPPTHLRLIESVVARLFDPKYSTSHNMDEFELHKQFPADGIEVYLQKPRLLNKVLGRSLKPQDWASIVGAPQGSKIHVYPRLSYRGEPQRLHIRVVHPDYVAERIVEADRNDVLQNKTSEVREEAREQGLGLRILADQVDGAWKHGFRHLELNAGGYGIKHPQEDARVLDQDDRILTGYIVWPKLGFNGSLKNWLDACRDASDRRIARIARDFESRFPHVTTIMQLMRTEEGRHWWADYGEELELSFDLKPGSPNRRFLDKKVKERAEKDNRPESGAKSLSQFAADELYSIRSHAWLMGKSDRFSFSNVEPAEHPDTLSPQEHQSLDRLWDEFGREQDFEKLASVD